MWLFTCRHEYEHIVQTELAGLGCGRSRILLPGLVAAELDAPCADLLQWDPAWALGVLPNAREVRGASVSALAEAVAAESLSAWPATPCRFDVHVLVPGQLKGQPNPQLKRRAELVEALVRKKILQGLPRKPGRHDPVGRLAQLLMMDVDLGYASACVLSEPGGQMRWPPLLPAGLALPADDLQAPSSAFRKLREALACMGEEPGPGELAVDLGASPGGWTHVLRQCGATVTAVDRAPLDRRVAADPRVHWVAGDAFSWLPAEPVDWLVSDVIAYPQRVPELLALWCGRKLARRFVVQMKFKGDPDLDLVQSAVTTARSCGYFARAKHFFNDKHEVTLMGGALH